MTELVRLENPIKAITNLTTIMHTPMKINIILQSYNNFIFEILPHEKMGQIENLFGCML